MFERFTDRARNVMALANQEAQRHNHEYIGTEHILLGLVKEGSGVAFNVLNNLHVDLLTVRQEVDKLVRDGPDMVASGKLPQTPRAKKVILYAIDESRRLDHNYVGTEHVLLGLLREKDGVAAQVFRIVGVTFEQVETEVLGLLGSAKAEMEKRAGLTEGPTAIHPFDEWFSHIYPGDQPSGLRQGALIAWNAAVHAAKERLFIQTMNLKSDLLNKGQFEHAAVVRDLPYDLENLVRTNE